MSRATSMRQSWNRSTPILQLSPAQLTTLVQPAFPGQAVVACEPAQGGLANTNIRVRLSKETRPLLVRLYVRRPEAGATEYALNGLVFSHTPVPRFFYFAPDNSITGHPYALMEWIEGRRLEVVAPTMPPAQVSRVGQSVGAALAGVHTITFAQSGFFDANLDIKDPVSVDGEGLLTYLHACLATGRGAERLGAELTRAVLAFVEDEAGLLDTWTGPPCLTHGDFGGSNLLVRAAAGGWVVAAVLDWEFAFSGSPFFDLGNLLRPPLGELAGFEQGVYAGYTGAGGRLPDRWRRMSRLIDLSAWAEFLNRPTISPALLRDAKAVITRTLSM